MTKKIESTADKKNEAQQGKDKKAPLGAGARLKAQKDKRATRTRMKR